MINSEPPRPERRMAVGIAAIGIVAATIAGTVVVTQRAQRDVPGTRTIPLPIFDQASNAATITITFVLVRNRKLPMPADNVTCSPAVAGALLPSPVIDVAAGVATCDCTVTVPRASFFSPAGMDARVKGRTSDWRWDGMIRVTGLEPATGVAR